MADLRVSPYGFTIDFGKHGQLNPRNVCSGTQDTTWIEIISDNKDILEQSLLSSNYMPR